MTSQSGFAGNLEEALRELEALTGALHKTDPDDLATVEGLLARRQQAVLAVTAQRGNQAPWPEAQAARLTMAWQGGEQFEERLKLVAAGTRHQLQELYRGACLARAISADLEYAGHNFDIEA